MIVTRRTFVVKRGCMGEAVEMMKALREQSSETFRIYSPNVAPFDILVVELEYGSLEKYEKAWEDWIATPEAGAFMERWYDITEVGGTNEIWNLEI